MPAELSKAVQYFVIAEKLRLGKRLEKALAGFQKVVDEESDFYEAYDKMGEVSFAMGKEAHAIEYFGMAAAGFVQAKKYVAAAKVYLKITTLDPDRVRESSQKVKEMLSKLPFVDAKVLDNSLVCELIPRPAFFESLNDKEFANIIKSLRPIELNAGETLFEEGDNSSKSMYLIYSGRMAVVVRNKNGEDMTVASLKAGEFFGEFSLLTDAPRSATMRAQEDTCLFELTRDEMRKKMQQHKGIRSALQDYYKKRVLDLTLAKSQLFSNLDPQQRQPLLNALEMKFFTHETKVLDSELLTDELFLIKSGKVQVFFPDKSPEPLQELGPGDFFGDLRSVGGLPEVTKVIASEDCEVFVLPPTELKKVLKSSTSVQKYLAKTLNEQKSSFLAMRATHE